MSEPRLPAGLEILFERIRDAGGRALLVGGCVRDALLDVASKDVDIEVHELPVDTLLPLLKQLGRVDEVGRSFGVFKLRWRGEDVDIALPRRDRREGRGHKGIAATSDPALGVREAARRRDLTVNAIAWDPLQRVYEDPFGGRADLRARRLRAVDHDTFGEDPLRALRVAQFAARFDFGVAPELEQLCAEMPLEELPSERVRGEVEKLILKGRQVRRGWDLAWRTGMWRRVVPVWDHECPQRLERVCATTLEEGPKLAAAYAAAGPVTDALDALKVFRREGYPVRDTALFLERHAAMVDASDAVLRGLADEGPIALLAVFLEQPWLLDRARALGVADGPLPALVAGKDLVALGVRPGPRMGALLDEVRRAQIAGTLQTSDEARAWLRDRVT